MHEKTFITIAEALQGDIGPLSRKVLQYSMTYKQVTDAAKGSKITPADWAPLAQLVAVDEFERVGAQKEVMDWATYTAFVSEYANSATWDGSFRRITEVPGLVFLELEERGGGHDGSHSYKVNTITVYEFNDAGKLKHLDVYIQGPAR
jgi:hypothetical protein